MKTNVKWLIGILIVALLVPAARSSSLSPRTPAAGPWYVATDGNDSNDCLSPATACATITWAIGKASSGDTVYVSTGTYTGTGEAVVLVSKSVTLSGGWEWNGALGMQSGLSIIDGQGARRGINLYSGVTAVVERFTIQNGYVEYHGGGIYNDGGTLILKDCVVRDNTVANDYGGGVSSYNGTMMLNNCTVSGNTAGREGGGIWSGGADTVVNNSTISGNKAEIGGGIWTGGGLVLNNSTVSGNTAQTGGGIYDWTGGSIVNNSTVSGNAAAGGGINASEGPVSLQNSIVAGNLDNDYPDCSGNILSLGYNLIGNTLGCTVSSGSGDLVNVDADLGPLMGPSGSPKYYPLLRGSPAIDAGNPAGCTEHLGNPLNTDQRGAVRVGRCDMGAYEYTSPGPASSIYTFGSTPQSTAPFSAFETPLQAVVFDNIGTPVEYATVSLSAPRSGASGTFADSDAFTTTTVAAESGVATAATFTANGLRGSYMVTATVSDVVAPAHFSLTNFGWYVAQDGHNASDCQTAATPCAAVFGVLGKAGFKAGDTVLVSKGTHTGTGDEVILLNENVRLLGGWNGTFSRQSGTSIIDGEGSRRGITVNSGVTAIVEQFVIQNGSSQGVEGGGIRNDGGILTLSRSTVSGNMANSGGGIFNDGGTLILNSSVVSDNRASNDGGGILNSGTLNLSSVTISENTAGNWGGGICNWETANLESSTVSANTASNGGGVYNFLATAHLNNSNLSDNTATDDGGGIANVADSTVVLNDSTISGNRADDDGGGIVNGSRITLNRSTVKCNTAGDAGGGVYNGSYGDLNLSNSTLSGNTAARGGGIYTYAYIGIGATSTLKLNYSTVSGNTATDSGGGIYRDTGTVALWNTILAGNMASEADSDCSGTITSLGYNLIGNTVDCAFSPTTGDLTTIDPKLGSLLGSPAYHFLSEDSPAVDAGNPNSCTDFAGNPLATDQRGASRPLDGDRDGSAICDIGAFEFDPDNTVGQLFLPIIARDY